MAIDLYYKSGSPPCHAALLTAKALNIDVNLKLVNLTKREHKTPEYKKINPQAKVPALVDDGFILCESRAIMMYLVDKYGDENNTLYPKHHTSRALVNSRLFFDIGSFYQSFDDYYYSVVFRGQSFEKNKFENLKRSLRVLETFLEDQNWVAGLHITIADLSLVVGIATLDCADIIDLQKDFPNIFRWYTAAKTQIAGYKDVVEKGIDDFKNVVNKILGEINPFNEM